MAGHLISALRKDADPAGPPVELSAGLTDDLFNDVGRMREVRIHGDHVLWIEGPGGGTQVMYYDLSWLGTGVEAVVLDSPYPATDVEIGERYVVWTERYDGQNDVVAYDLRQDIQIAVAFDGGINEQYPDTGGPWITWEAREPSTGAAATGVCTKAPLPDSMRPSLRQLYVSTDSTKQRRERTAMSESSQNVRKALQPIMAIYQTLMGNTVLRNSLGRAELSDSQWQEIQALASLGEESPPGDYDAYYLYAYIRSMLAFARSLATEVKPALRSQLSLPRSQMSTENRIAVEMTASNLDNNTRILLDRLSDLYVAVTHLDESLHGRNGALRHKFPDLADASAWRVEL